MEKMKSADSSQFPWQRRAVPAHSALLLSAEPRPPPSLLPQFSSFSSCCCLFFHHCCCCCLQGSDPIGHPDLCPPPQLFLLHSASSLHSSFNVPYFLLSRSSLPPSPSSFLWSFLMQLYLQSPSRPKINTSHHVFVALKRSELLSGL